MEEEEYPIPRGPLSYVSFYWPLVYALPELLKVFQMHGYPAALLFLTPTALLGPYQPQIVQK